jgi:ABC-type lipopolysaccharide export system ATPase subunit
VRLSVKIGEGKFSGLGPSGTGTGDFFKLVLGLVCELERNKEGVSIDSLKVGNHRRQLC